MGVVGVVAVFSEAGGTGITPFIVPREVIKSKMGCCDVVAMVGVEYGEIIYIYLFILLERMPHINPHVLIRHLEKLQELVSEIWGLSKNFEINAKAEEAGELIDNLLRTARILSPGGNSEKSPPSPTSPTEV